MDQPTPPSSLLLTYSSSTSYQLLGSIQRLTQLFTPVTTADSSQYVYYTQRNIIITYPSRSYNSAKSLTSYLGEQQHSSFEAGTV